MNESITEKLNRIREELRNISSDMCDNYCKFPEIYHNGINDPNEAEVRLLIEKCANCPLAKL